MAGPRGYGGHGTDGGMGRVSPQSPGQSGGSNHRAMTHTLARVPAGLASRENRFGRPRAAGFEGAAPDPG